MWHSPNFVATPSDECRAQLALIQFVEQELNRLQAKVAALQTAKTAFGIACAD